MFRLFLIKEVKRHPLFFLLQVITLMLGTLGLTGVSVISEQVKSKLELNARELLTSDLAVSARRDLTLEEKEALKRLTSKYSHQAYRVIDVYSMIRHEKNFQTRLVEVRAIEESFPFYGEIMLEGNQLYRSDSLVISRDLAELWRIQTGDSLKLGEKTFPVAGIVEKDSSVGLRGFSLAPRIYLPLNQLEKTGLLRPGATGSFAYHFLFKNLPPSEISKMKADILEAIPDRAVKASLPTDTSEQSGRVISYLTDFMALAALIGLLLSLVGIFYLYQSHLLARLKDLCLFNLLGLTKFQILLGLTLQFSSVFFLVYLLQLIFIVPGYRMIMPYLSNSLGLDLSQEVNLKSAMLQLPFLYGLVITILFPLLLGLLRTAMGVQLKSAKLSLGKFRFFDFAPFCILLWAFACYLSHSYKTGSLFFLGLCLVFVLSTLLILALQKILKIYIRGRSLKSPNLVTGIALRNIIRSGHRLTLSFLSLAMGATLISLILQLDRLIQKEFVLDEKKPSLFLFDIQEEQLEDLKRFASEKKVELEGVTPLIRARLELLNGKPFIRGRETDNLRTREEEVEGRFRNRGINLTYRMELTPAERIVEGDPFPKRTDFAGTPWVSLEKRYASRLGVEVGDLLTFDVQGLEVEAKVLNLRDVKWTSFRPNFFVNFEPGFIDEAPKTYLAVLPQIPRDQKAEFQRDSIDRFPNVSFVDVEELINRLSGLFEKSRQAMEFISWLSLGVGLVILYGLSHDQVYRRYYDLALMKTLGFGPGDLRKHLLIEFGTIFFLAMSVGFFLGWSMAIIIGREVFKISWGIDWSRVLVPFLALSILCLVTILLASRKAVKSQARELLSDS